MLEKNVSSLKQWVEELSRSVKDIESLPDLLRKIEPKVKAQDLTVIQDFEKARKEKLIKSLADAEGRFVFIEDTDTFDDYPFVKHVIDTNPKLKGKINLDKISFDYRELYSGLMSLRDLPEIIDEFTKFLDNLPSLAVKAASHTATQIMNLDEMLTDLKKSTESNELVFVDNTVLIAAEIAIKHAQKNPEERLGIAIISDSANIPGHIKYFAGEIYFLSLIADELWFNHRSEVNFIYGFKNDFSKFAKFKTGKRLFKHSCSDLICEWPNSKIGLNIITPQFDIPDGMENQLKLRYKSESTLKAILKSIELLEEVTT